MTLTSSSFFRPRFLKGGQMLEKYFLLHQEPKVASFFERLHPLIPQMEQLSIEERYVLEVMIYLGEGEPLFSWPYEPSSALIPLKLLAQDLLAVEKFYEKIGGVYGYHERVVELVSKKNEKDRDVRFFKPEVRDIRIETSEVREKIFQGLQHLPEFAAIFPIGGVGDRLGLIDPTTKQALPTAMLPFLGKSLFELLFHDLSGLEYLYRKTFDREILLPVVVMTSQEKKNHERIVRLCEENGWFGRPKESFRFIQQISVPVLTQKGGWVISAPLQLSWKPGGHGMLWKLMQDEKVFDWLGKLGKTRAFIRQINNPVAGIDHGLLALMGVGSSEQKAFGFAACPRRVHAAEGVDVFREKRGKEGYEYGYANIEYTDFAKWNIQDSAIEGDSYSEYPSNTNLLYVDLQEANRAVEKDPFVGMMLNMKAQFPSLQKDGSRVEEVGGRLELMMQSIADLMTDHFLLPLKSQDPKKLKTFVLYNDRKKTISTTKRLWEEGCPFMETPEGCFFDLLKNHYELLSQICQMELPLLESEEEYLKKGPPFLVYLHPALGPLYSEIQKKIRKGKLFYGSELHLELGDLFMENTEIQGSLIIQTKGEGKKALLGRCLLKNVRVLNEGFDRNACNVYWKNRIKRNEALHVLLHERAEFVAEGVVFEKNHRIEVPAMTRVVASMSQGKLSLHSESI